MRNLSVIYVIISILLFSGCNVESLSYSSEKSLGDVKDIKKDSTEPYPTMDAYISTQIKYLNAINLARAQKHNCGKYGVKQATGILLWNNNLYKASYEHSTDMATVNKLSHDGSGTSSDWTANILNLNRGSHVIERIKNNRYIPKNGMIAENILYISKSISAIDAVELWLKSDGHCANIMNPNFTEFGMAYATDEHGGEYWTIDLGG